MKKGTANAVPFHFHGWPDQPRNMRHRAVRTASKASSPSMRSVPPAALRWPPPPNCTGHGTHVRGARGTQAELVDAGRVFPQDAGGLHAAQAAELLHQPFQIFLEGPALAQVFQTASARAARPSQLISTRCMSRAQSAMRAGLQLLSSFSRSLWMSQPLSLSRAARRKTAAVVLPCRKPPVSVTSPRARDSPSGPSGRRPAARQT